MYLLDTNICIYAVKGTYQEIAKKLLTGHPDKIKISAVTVFELEYGAAKSRWGERSREALHMFLSNFEILPFSEEDAAACGTIRAELEAKGAPIGAYDLMIAAQGLAKGLKVVTHNVREFQRVPNLAVEDWVGQGKG